MSASSAEVIRSDVEARILVVDDEPEIATLVAESLREADPAWHVDVETDANRALEHLKEEPFDCLVTDLIMPTLGGLNLAEQALALHENLAMIAITGRGSLETSIEAMRMGFADYIPKPFDLDVIQKAVCRTLHRHRQQTAFENRFAELAETKVRLEANQAQLTQKLDIASHDLVLSNKRMARQMEDLAAAADVARSLMGVIELEDLLGLCAEMLGDRVACQTSTVVLYEPQESSIGLMVRARPDSDDPPTLCWLRTPIRSGILVRAAQAQKSIHVNDLTQSVLAGSQERELWREGRLLVVPIPLHDQSIGVAALHRLPAGEDFSVQDIKRITELAKIMGPAVLSAKMHHGQRCRVYASLESIAAAVETRDPYLKGHSERILGYTQPLVAALELSQPQVGALQIAARLHDIGHIVIPDAAINHPGPLTEAQWELVRQHPVAGAEFLKSLDFFGEVGLIIRGHHESYDGTGYPDRKAGEEIPLVSRLLAVADAFDSMTSPRPYREAMDMDEAIDQIRRLSGQQFDPRVVEAFANISKATLADIQSRGR